ncbi:MAG: LytTR family DNA-binding domain-containing protein [Oscillospiraceae bacterium]|jgi:DNA-binding LytR/AlgR family response regulator|nr:LytTR family DNA-binding domain-containing protein [Oscillospiraceae bacterium]
MRVAICDDEARCVEDLRGLLTDYAKRQDDLPLKIKTYLSGEEFCRHLAMGRFDIVFLDVSMPEMDGFEVAQRIRTLDLDVLVVFITYLEEYMAQSFSVTASDYLVKPVSQVNFDTTLARLQVLLAHRQTSVYTIHLKGGGDKTIPLSNIFYLASDGHYIRAVTLEGEFYYIGKLSDEEEKLTRERFVRTHQSYLINMAHIFITFDDHVSLKDGTEIPVSRKYLDRVRECMG